MQGGAAAAQGCCCAAGTWSAGGGAWSGRGSAPALHPPCLWQHVDAGVSGVCVVAGLLCGAALG